MMAMVRLLGTEWSELVRAAYSRGTPDAPVLHALDPLTEADLMTAVEAAVVEYVNDPALCSDQKDEFPSRALLTGSYCVDRLADYGVREGRRRLLVSCACLRRQGTGEAPYLGLDVLVSWALGEGLLRVDRVDSFAM